MSEFTHVYGLTVRSDVPLHQERVVPPVETPDLNITLGDRIPRVDTPPPGRVLLDLRANRQYYTATETDDGYHLRFYSTCDIRLDRELSSAEVRLCEQADPALASVLVAGTTLAFVLTVKGYPVLHASTVQVGDGALAFVGGSGMGKSTMATLMCASGASLITDDILRLDLSPNPPTCKLGATELRLRKGADELATEFRNNGDTRTTGDGRRAIATPVAKQDDLPLRAIVIPVPDHSPVRNWAVFERVDPKRAFLLLSRFPRLLGWQDEAVIANCFHNLADVVENVPVHVAVLPWGPPFAAGLARSVADATGMALPVAPLDVPFTGGQLSDD